VAHDAQLLKGVDLECPFGLCIINLVGFASGALIEPQDSNQLAEARQYFAIEPESITTKFVAFSSYRLPEKTNGQIGHHDFCKLMRNAKTDDVYAPYLIKNSLERLINLPENAPPYTINVLPIYADLVGLWATDFSNLLSSPQKMRKLVMCNSFACSTEVYTEFHKFITRVILDCWRINEFKFDWAHLWESTFPNRETGLLIERATALWFAQQNLNIHGTHWGKAWPKKFLNYHPEMFGWRGNSGDDLDLTN
jgi:hypothetical protein